MHSMPQHHGPDLEVDRLLPKYDYIGFMERMAGAGGIGGNEAEGVVVVDGGAAQGGPQHHHGVFGRENVRPAPVSVCVNGGIVGGK